MSHTLLSERATTTVHSTGAPALSATGWLVTAGLCLIAVAVGTAVGRVWGRRRAANRTQPAAIVVDQDQSPAQGEAPSAERAALVLACIRIRGLSSDPAIREIADDGLAKGGVVPIIPTGQRFDPHRHQSVGELPTADPAQDCIIARTDRPGYDDHGRRIRPPEVLVLRFRVA
ncbi:MAG TPA: nucleotide exchange factor GrpE [Frankiaceae bacterium]|jgi:hypothetical protein|nr:nucleotide exchange factor GrpE [Frankiaceae bacterium]